MHSDLSPTNVDTARPSTARMYDYLLGGTHNFPADRAVTEQLLRFMPELPSVARANRAYLRRAVRYCVEVGIRQFLDLGSGVPTVGNVHEVAQGLAPQSRVVYVDIDPVAVQHSHSILAGNRVAGVVQADLREPDAVLADPGVVDLLDLAAPVAVLMVSVLHFVSDKEDPAAIVARFRDATAPGSHLVIAHASAEEQTGSTEQRLRAVQEVMAHSENRMSLRTAAEIEALLDGYELVEPGLVRLPLWHPESAEELTAQDRVFPGYAAVGRK
jgi:SAM-dependent methyltransferase